MELHHPARRHAFCSLTAAAARDVDCESAMTVSQRLVFSQRCFTSALVRRANDEEKTCERVTHGCVVTGQQGPKKNERHDSQSRGQPGVNGQRIIYLKNRNLLVGSEMRGFPSCSIKKKKEQAK